MLGKLDTTVAYIIVALGILFTLFINTFIPYPSPDGVLLMGTTLLLVFLGFLNLARIKSQNQSAKILSIISNVIALLFLISAFAITGDPAAFIPVVPVLFLCVLSWMNPKIGSQKKA